MFKIQTYKLLTRFLMIITLALGLAACGGSSGGGTTSDDGGGNTTPPPTTIPTASVPLSAGKKWLYNFNRVVTVPQSSTASSNFTGEAILHVEKQIFWQGRSAWRLVKYELEGTPSGDNAFDVEVEYLVQDANGLERWYSGLSQWKRILSKLTSSFGTNTLMMTREPNSSSTTTLSQVSVSVPAGTYSTVKANAKYREGFTTFATVDHDEDHSEYYADGVGLVKSIWDFWYDDNDPAAFDVYEVGSAVLTAIDTGSFPSIVTEAEANNTNLSAQTLPGSYSIVAGNVHISDIGGIITSTDVFANINGVKKPEDWYAFSHPGGSFRLDMRFDSYTNGAFNDLDVYLFRRGTLGALTFVNRSTNDPTVDGDIELITDSLTAGTYVVAIQAWDTPTSSVDYWFVIR